MPSIYNWSYSAASNANADNIINWQEGQPPSTVNNSARAMMQRIREFVGDLGGGAIAGGAANSITLQVDSQISGYTSGIIVRFRAIFRNTGGVTINLNSLGGKPVVCSSPVGLVALKGGEIQQDSLYEILYYPALYSNTGGWFLTNPTPEQAIPAGTISAFGMATPPRGWLKCNGALVSRTNFSALFAAIGTTWGGGNGTTTFKLPDLRGMFLRGMDEGRGQDESGAARQFATAQADQNRAHNHTGATVAAGNHTHQFEESESVHQDWVNNGTRSWGFFLNNKEQMRTRTTQAAGGHSHTIPTDGGVEARPKNVAIIYAIKT